MKKLNSICISKFLLLSFTLVFTACENFLTGNMVKDAIDEQIEYYLATPTTVTISARPETLAQIVPNVGDYSYKKGDPITLRFIASDAYMFKYWEAKPSNIIKFDNEKEINTVANLTEYADKVNIYPVCVKRPEVISFEPRNTDGIHYKNSHIKIEFDHELSEENDFSQIEITMNGNSVKDSFFDPEWDKTSKRLIIRANTKYIDLKSETETISVKIPGSFYYIEDGLKVEIGKDKTYTYKINSATYEKAEIHFELDDKESGTLTYSQKTDNKYNIGEIINVNYKLAEGWVFFGWNIENGKDIVHIADDSELKTTVEVLNQSIESVKISPITFKRPEASFSPEKTQTGVPKNSSINITFTKPLSMENNLSKITITMGSENVLEHFEEPEWVDGGKGILFQANNDNPIGYTGIDTASIVVKVPADFYYEENGYKISFSELQSYEYKINSKTNVTTKIKFWLDDVSSGKLTPSSETEYNLGDKIQVRFTPGSDWQFTGWKLTGGSGVIKLTETGDYTAEVQVLKPSTEVVDISPVVFKRLRLDSVSPENVVNGVPKNSPIVLNFTEPLPDSDDITDLLKNITVKSGEEDLMEGGCFFAPKVSTDRKTVIIDATKNYIELTSGTRTVTVTVPAELYYEIEEDEIYAGKNLSFSYRVNTETCEKTFITFSRMEGNWSGELAPVGRVPYNLGEYKAVNFVIDSDKYRFIKWYCSDETAVELITEGVGFGYDDRGFNASTGVATAYFRILNSAENVVITPMVEAIPTMKIYAESKYGRFSQSVGGSYKEGDVLSLNFTSDSDYQFIRWQVKDRSSKTEIKDWKEHIEIDNNNLENPNTSFTLVKAASDVDYLIEPLCASRPKIVSNSPLYTTTGDNRDRTLVIMFNSKMDTSSIYYNDQELVDLGIISEETKLPLPGYGVLEKEGDRYGYYKTSNGIIDDNSIVFKNIEICKLNNQNVNLLKHYEKPIFDKGNTGVLRIPTKITDMAKGIDEAPPKYTEILVTLDTGINTNKDGVGVKLSGQYSWAYYTGSATDSTPPEFIMDAQNFDIRVSSDGIMSYESLETEGKASLVEFTDLSNPLTNDVSNIKNYNARDDYIWFKMKIKDDGAGVASVHGVLTKVNNKYYPTESGQDEILDSKIKFTLGGSETDAVINENISLKEYGLTEGLYAISFEATDKNDHKTYSDKSYQFVYDNVAPKSIDVSEERSLAAITTLKWTNPDEKDFAGIKVVSTNMDEEKETLENNFGFNEYSYQLGTYYENKIQNLEPYKHYSHNIIISDYAGNENKITVTDTVKPAPITNLKETRNRTKSATLTWTKPSEADFGKVIIKRVNKTAEEKNETPEEDTVDVLSTASQTKVYTAMDFNRYEYTATVVDYSGNESEPVTITDEEKPASITNLKETRTVKNSASLTWTKPSEVDFGKVVIKRVNKTAEEKNEDPEEDTVDVLSTAIQSKVYTAKDFYRYEYTATVVDYSGNESEPVTITDEEKPAKIISLKENRTSRTNARVNWTCDSDIGKVTIDCYKTEKMADGSGKETLVNTNDVLTSDKKYIDYTTLENGVRYVYKVTTTDYSGNTNTEIVSFTDEQSPGRVADSIKNTRASAANETISWTKPTDTDFDHVRIEQYDLTDSGKKVADVTVEKSFNNKQFSGLINQHKYKYRIYTVDFAGNENTLSRDFQDNDAPGAVTGISGTRASAANETISWTKPTDSDFDHVRIVQYDTYNNSEIYNSPLDKAYCSKEFINLTNQHRYEYRFYTVDYSGNESSSYAKYSDVTPPAQLTIRYSEGRNGKVNVFFTSPNDTDYFKTTVSHGSSTDTQYTVTEANGRNVSSHRSFTGAVNGTTYYYYFRTYDYSGNCSSYVYLEEMGGAMPGMICYAPNNSSSNIFCSKNYWSGKNPIGYVCEGSNQSSVKIWDINEATGYCWGYIGDPNSDTETGWNKGADMNYADGMTWYKDIVKKKYSNLIDYTGDDVNNYLGYKPHTIWYYLENVKNKNSAVTWYIPSPGEFKYILDNYNAMKAPHSKLTSAGISATLVTSQQPYWTGVARYYDNYAFVGAFNTTIEGGLDWSSYHKNSSSDLKYFALTSNQREKGWYYKDRAIDVVSNKPWWIRTHAMAIINMQ